MVPGVNGNVNENVDVDVNARVTREISPAAEPVDRGEPTAAGVGTGEGEESGDLQPLTYVVYVFCVDLWGAKSCQCEKLVYLIAKYRCHVGFAGYNETSQERCLSAPYFSGGYHFLRLFFWLSRYFLLFCCI